MQSLSRHASPATMYFLRHKLKQQVYGNGASIRDFKRVCVMSTVLSFIPYVLCFSLVKTSPFFYALLHIKVLDPPLLRNDLFPEVWTLEVLNNWMWFYPIANVWL